MNQTFFPIFIVISTLKSIEKRSTFKPSLIIVYISLNFLSTSRLYMDQNSEWRLNLIITNDIRNLQSHNCRIPFQKNPPLSPIRRAPIYVTYARAIIRAIPLRRDKSASIKIAIPPISRLGASVPELLSYATLLRIAAAPSPFPSRGGAASGIRRPENFLVAPRPPPDKRGFMIELYARPASSRRQSHSDHVPRLHRAFLFLGDPFTFY